MKMIFYTILLGTSFFSALQSSAQSKYALSFNGTNQHVICGNRNDLEFSGTSTYTLEAWVKLSGTGNRTILSKYNAGVEGTYILGINSSNQLYMGRGASPTITTSVAAIPNNVFTHIAASYDGSDVKLYINGQLDIALASGATATAPNINVVIGAHYVSGVLSNYFNGTIDEVKVWNTAKTQAEIAGNMYKEARISTLGLIAYYKCNDGSGTTLTDSKTGPNGTLVNNPGFVASGANVSETSFFGNALHFDAIDDNVNLGVQPSLDFTNSSFTIQCSVYPTGVGSAGNGGGIIFSNEGRYQLQRLGYNGELVFSISATSPQFNVITNTGLFLPLQTWTDITFVYDRAVDSVFVYANGVSNSFKMMVTGNIVDYLPGFADIVMMGGRIANSHFYDGKIDELRIWNVAKSKSEIRLGHNLPVDPAAPGLFAYYRFDEAIADGNNSGITSILDIGPNRLHGALTNFGLTGTTSNLVQNETFNTWAGTISNNWGTAGNWDNDQVPGAANNIYIPAGTANSPVVNNAQSVNSLIVAPGINMLLNADLHVAGDLYKHGPFTGAGTLFLNGTTDQGVFGAGSLDNLTIDNPPFNVATLYDTTDIWGTIIATTDATIWTGGFLTMKSDANRTAISGNSPGRILDSIFIERYIPNLGRRAWHLLTYSSHSHQKLFYSWQEAGANIPGQGTLITSDLYNGSNGFDMTSTSASILTYNQGFGAAPSWNYDFPSTLVDGSLKQGYLLYIRGDRNYTPSTPGTSATVLRHKGILWQPYRNQLPVTIWSTGPGYILVGNPYASPIDFETIHAIANLRQNFFIWDPALTGPHGLGGYRLVERTAGGDYQSTPSLGTAQDALLRYINAGMAFFLKSDGADISVGFNQNSKAVINGPVNPIVATPGDQQILVHLQIVEPANVASTVDGTRVRFDAAYNSNSSDDVEKMANFTENISSFRGGKTLIVEKRPMIATTDTIFLRITNSGIKNYRLHIEAIDYVQTIYSAYLQDTYLNTNTVLNLSGANNDVDFSITSNPASGNPDRFRIVFNLNGPLPVSFTSVNAAQKGSSIEVEWKVSNQINIKKYEVEKSTDGINYNKVETKSVIGNSGGDATYSWLDVNAVLGNNYYRVKSIGIGGDVSISRVVVVKIGKGKPEISVYPNPVSDHYVSIQFTGMEKGIYYLRLVNNLGQVLLKKTITHEGGSATKTVFLGDHIVNGTYQLEITKPDNTKTATALLVTE